VFLAVLASRAGDSSDLIYLTSKRIYDFARHN
jgi:hypothetical protein